MEKEVIDCECGTCSLQIAFEKEEDYDTFYFAMYYFGSYRRGFWGRIKLAWEIFKRGTPYEDQLCLHPREAQKLSAFINKHITPPPATGGEGKGGNEK